MCRTRTNIEIDDELLAVVMKRYRLRTKTEAVDLALRRLAGQPMSRDEALAMRGRRSLGSMPRETNPPRQ
jgi:Arc/MetJ family transcription regulator